MDDMRSMLIDVYERWPAGNQYKLIQVNDIVRTQQDRWWTLIGTIKTNCFNLQEIIREYNGCAIVDDEIMDRFTILKNLKSKNDHIQNIISF